MSFHSYQESLRTKVKDKRQFQTVPQYNCNKYWLRFHLLTVFLCPFYKNLLVSDYFISLSIFKQEDCKEIQPVHSKGDQSWVFFGRTDTKAETPVLCQLMRRVDSLEKTDAGRDWWQEENGTTEDEMAGWHHQLDGHEFE